MIRLKYYSIAVLLWLSIIFCIFYFFKKPTPTQVSTKVIKTKKKSQIIEIKSPDGTVKTIRTITEDTSSTKTEIKNKTTNISALIGTDTTDKFKPIYGVSASKELIGSMTVGAFGLTNGVIGVSVGVNF